MDKKQKHLFIMTAIFASITMLIIGVFIGTFIASNITEHEQQIPLDTFTGENFQYTTLDNTTSELKNHQGKIIILDLWATWCQPCVYQMVELSHAYENYSADIEILSISVEETDTLTKIKSYKNELSLLGVKTNWVFGINSSLSSLLVNDAIPTLIIYDENGEILYQHSGIIFYDLPFGYEQVEDQSIFDILLKDIISDLMEEK